MFKVINHLVFVGFVFLNTRSTKFMKCLTVHVHVYISSPLPPSTSYWCQVVAVVTCAVTTYPFVRQKILKEE